MYIAHKKYALLLIMHAKKRKYTVGEMGGEIGSSSSSYTPAIIHLLQDIVYCSPLSLIPVTGIYIEIVESQVEDVTRYRHTWLPSCIA